MTKWEIFWIIKLEAIQGLFVANSVIVGAIVAILLFLLFITFDAKEGYGDYDMRMRTIKWLKFIVPIFIFICLPLSVLTPTTKQYLSMVGGEYITNNEKVIETGEKTFELLDTYMDNKLKELKGETK